MFKKLSLLLVVPGLLFSSVVKKEFSFSTPVVQNGKIIMPGCNALREPFAPSLVQKNVCLVLPVGHKALSFNVSYGEPVELNGSYYLSPAKQDGRLSFAPPVDYLTRSSEMYDKNEFYPASVRKEFFTTQYKNGIPQFITNIVPVQYNPVSGTIRYYPNISVEVVTEAVREELPVKFFPHIKSLLKNQVDNPEALDNIPYTKKRAESYDYLIITIDALKDSYTDFIAFNKRRGLNTKVQVISWIKSNMTGADDAEKIRAYIKDQYTNCDITFVLLGGDDDNNNTNDIAKRGLRSEMYDYGVDYYDDKDVAADLYFSCLDGTWKVSGSSYYGEFGSEDIGYEVYAARFPVDNATELTNMVNKTIKYSETPVTETVINNLVAGEFLWGPPDHPVSCYGKDCMVQLYGTCSANNYTTTGFPATGWNRFTLFDKDKTWTKAEMIASIKNNKITWIDHVGHSNTGYIMKLYTSDVTNTNFTNNGTIANYFLATTWGCYPGSFDNRGTSAGSYSTTDCIAEAFTSGIANGAVAFWSNTRYGLGDNGSASADGTDGSNHRYERFFHDAIFGKKIHYLEMMNGYSKEQNKTLICESDLKKKPYTGQMKWCAYEMCVLGDPALSIWTAKPTTLTADHPTTIIASATAFTWDTKKPYTTVALLSGDGATFIASQITGEDGKCNITDDALKTYLTANPTGKIKINVKAHNYLPYAGEINCSSDIKNNVQMKIKSLQFNGTNSRLTYTLPAQSEVNIALYDSKGAIVKTVVSANQGAGEYSVPLAKNRLSNGIYYLTMSVNNSTITEKLVITK